MKSVPSRLRFFGFALVALLFSSVTRAQPATTGSIEGRVQNVTKGDYLNNARVTLEHSNLSTLTNEFGEYRITDVPAGEVKITVFYSGLLPVTEAITVAAGVRAVKDFDLRSTPAASDIVQLSAYTVSSTRETSQSAIATNEQRFAPNIKTVLSSEEFGEQSENNVAEFLKLMPAIQIDYVEQDARNASIRGMPAHTTIVTSNGNQIASAASGGASRVFEFEQVSINEVARVEVNKSLMPDMPAEGIGGTINLITKSAFERSRPDFKFRSYANFNTTELNVFKKTPGPFNKSTYKTKPGFDFTYTNPISKNFGVTVSAASSTKYNPQWFADPTWTANPVAAVGFAVPYMSRFNYYDGPKQTDRVGGRIGVDWRFAPRDVISVGFSEQFYRALIGLRRHVVQPGGTPTAITSDYVQGRMDASSVLINTSQNDKSGTTWTPEFKYVHNGAVWKIEAGGAYSHAGNDYMADEKGFFSGVNMTAGGVVAGRIVRPSIRLDYTSNFLPEVTALLSDGRPLETHDAAQYTLDNATALDRKSVDLKKTLRLNIQRHTNVVMPVVWKVGGDIRQNVRDIRETTPAYTFVGPDGLANTPDNIGGLYDIFDEQYSKVAPAFGLKPIHWVDVYKVYNLFRTHPEWWTADPAAVHNNLVSTSKFITETITSGFIRFDSSLWKNRFLLSGGWRFQEYRVKSESGAVDSLGKYLQDEEGNLVFDPVTNRPVTLPGDAVETADRTNIERGVRRQTRMTGYYPSVNATLRLTENLQLRASFANSINYPQLSEILAVATVSDYTATTRQVVVNKPLKPWTAHNYDLELEYFTVSGGSFSFGGWRKQMTNFITTATYRGADAAPVLERNGYAVLIPLGYQVQEKFNGGNATMQGWEMAMSQKLDPILPEWARGVAVFGNTSYKAAHRGTGAAGLDAVSTRSINWGGNYRRGRFATTLKWNFVQEPKRASPSSTATHSRSRTYTDADVSFRVTKNLSVFAGGTNIFGVPVEQFVYSDVTPEYARRVAHRYFGVQCVAGLKGQY
jgi:iron complex outermembrane recepter protein